MQQDDVWVWSTDSNGNFTANSAHAVGDAALQGLETFFHQDLDGDGQIGPGQIGPVTTIEAFGATSLVEVGNQYLLQGTDGAGPTLSYAGAAVVEGQFGTWKPIAVEQTADGYQVVWKDSAARTSTGVEH